MQITFKKTVIVLSLTSLGLVGCANPGGSKEDTGAVLGALAGALIGSQAGKGQGRIVATILGAIGGGLIGKQFGRYLDEQDRQKIADATQLSAESNASQVYVSPKSGAKVTMTPTGQQSYELGPEILVVKGVDTNTALIADRQQFVLRNNTSALSGPSAGATSVKALDKGANVEMVARVANSPFRLVAQNGIAIGYVGVGDMLTPELANEERERADRIAKEREQAVKTAQAKPAAKPLANARNVRRSNTAQNKPSTTSGTETAASPFAGQANSTAQTGGSASPFAGQAVVASDAVVASVPTATPSPAATLVAGGSVTPDVQKISVSSECRIIKRVVEIPNGQRGTEDVKLCKEPPKEWKQIAHFATAESHA